MKIRLDWIIITAAWLGFSQLAHGQCPQTCVEIFNTGFGGDVLANLSGGRANTALGPFALHNNSTGDSNTATGFFALTGNTTGDDNTATGDFALEANTTGNYNTAAGQGALSSNTTGSYNTAAGQGALFSNTTSYNTAYGAGALFSNTTGIENTASGLDALGSNTTGGFNTATGDATLYNNTTGVENTAHGYFALFENTTGKNNTANGDSALQKNTSGSNNTAAGINALGSNTIGGSNIALGESAGINLTTGNNNIDIGNKGIAGESKTIRVGKKGTQTATFIAGISGTTVAGGVGVVIDTNGHLGTVTSSRRYKEQIKPMDKASEAVLSLQPVTFRYKHELDPQGIPEFGLVAEQVEKVNPDLVARDEQGKPYTVRYEAVNAMLLNEFLKEHRTVQELKSAAAKQEAIIGHQQEQIEALIAGLQKVSAQVETSRPATQTVVDNH